MIKSHNIFVVDSIDVEPIYNRTIVMVKLELRCYLEFRCSLTGVKYSQLNIISSGYKSSIDDSIKEAIQNLLSGNSIINYSIMDEPNIHSITHYGIDELQINLQEPLYTLFNNLFDPSKWRIVKLVNYDKRK